MTADICFKLNRTNVTFTQNNRIYFLIFETEFIELDL